jgi:hypothetical protein
MAWFLFAKGFDSTGEKKTLEKKLWLGVKEVTVGGRMKTRRNEKERNV